MVNEKMNFGIILLLIIFGFSLGSVIASWVVFTVVKNRGTIIGGQLITDDLTESAFLAFAVRINKHDSKTYRVPQDLTEARKAVINPKQWQIDHEREIKGKPTRIGILKLDGKLIPYLHYSFKKITVKEGTIDALIIEAFTEAKIGLGIEKASTELKQIKDKKVRKDAETYLKFLKDSYDNLLDELQDERSARIVLREQIMPMAQVLAAKLLGIDIDSIAKTLALPNFEKIVTDLKTKPLEKEPNENFEKLQEGIQQEIVKAE